MSAKFSFTFENTGVMKDGVIYTIKTTPDYNGKQLTLGDVMDDGDVDEKYFIPKIDSITLCLMLIIVMKHMKD